MPERLELRQLAVRIGQRALLHPTDAQLRGGELSAIIGPNGAGKSTLLRALLGTLPATGEVLLDGEVLPPTPAQGRARHMAWVPQQSQLTLPLPVWRVVAQGRHGHTGTLGRLRAEDHEAVHHALEQVQALPLLHRPWQQLSGGELRRVLIARALASQAPILLLDEPTASLDIQHALRTLELLRTLAAAGRIVVVVMHELDLTLRHFDRALLLNHGRTVAEGSPADVLSEAHLQQVYGVSMTTNAAPAFSLAGRRP